MKESKQFTVGTELYSQVYIKRDYLSGSKDKIPFHRDVHLMHVYASNINVTKEEHIFDFLIQKST